MAEIERYDNRLGIKGWLGGGRWGVERYAYILHRITGLGILFYFLLHIVVTSLRVQGIYLWAGRGFLHEPIFRFMEYLVFAAFAYHACNGFRLILVEFGFAIGKPMEPVYPYKTSLNVQRPLLVAMAILTLILLSAGAWRALAR